MKTLIFHPIGSVYLGINTLIMLASSFFFATYVPFLAENGMNLWQINLINSFFMATVILAEMPTGSFADNYGRHRSLALSCFLLSISTFVYFTSSSFLFFIMAEVVAALGHTFASGAAEAWLVDSLKERKEEHLQSKIFRLTPTFTSAGIISGVLLGSYLGKFNLTWPWLASSLLMFTVGCLTLFIKENYRASHQFPIKSSFAKEIKVAWQQGMKNKDLLFIMTFGACLALAVQALNMQWPLLFKNEFNFTSVDLGLLFVGISLCLALGAKFSKIMQDYLPEKIAIILPQLLTAISIIICAQMQIKIMVISFFLLHEFGRGILKPLQQNFINKRLSTINRATVLSLDSMFVKLGALAGLLISGFMAEQTSIRTTWIFSGIMLILALLIFFFIHKTKKVNNFKKSAL